MDNLDFSVDLQAELRKITQKQYLNQVHYLIQLVRHALTHQPELIEIKADQRCIRLTQRGSPFLPAEWALLQSLTSELSEEEKQKVLINLERRHGIAILSLLLNAPYVFIGGPTGTVVAKTGKVRWGGPSPDQMEGYFIELERPQVAQKDELEELKFYAGGVSTPVSYNGKNINQPIELPDQMLITRFENHLGNGAVGLPDDGDVCHITLYKQGVRVGMKQFVPEDGRIFHAFWNANYDRFESDFKKTINSGDKYIEQYSRQLYQEIPTYFADLEPARKERVKKIVMALNQNYWGSGYKTLPLFHGTGGNYVFSLIDLEELEKRFDGIPFVSKASKHVPGFVPCLLPEDIYFLKHGLNKALKLVARQGSIAQSRVNHLEPDVLATSDMKPDQLRFITRLLDKDPFCQFIPCRTGWGISTNKKGLTIVLLPLEHPEVMKALRVFRKNPEAIPAIHYHLLGLAAKNARN